jgi:hypothetical protein
MAQDLNRCPVCGRRTETSLRPSMDVAVAYEVNCTVCKGFYFDWTDHGVTSENGPAISAELRRAPAGHVGFVRNGQVEWLKK